MDATGLSVSIEVDMSGFIEAMEALAALIMTIADELGDLQTGFANASNGISNFNKDAEETTDLIGAIIECAGDLLAIFAGDEVEAFPLLLHLMKLAVDVKKVMDNLNKSSEQSVKVLSNRSQSKEGTQNITTKVKENKANVSEKSDTTSDGLYDIGYVFVPNIDNNGGTFMPKAQADSIAKTRQNLSQNGDSTSTGAQPSVMQGANMPSAGTDTAYKRLPVIQQDATYVAPKLSQQVQPSSTQSEQQGDQQVDESQKKLADFKKNLELVQQMMGKINPVLKIKVDATPLTQQTQQLGTVINQQNTYIQQINNTTAALAKETDAQKKAAEAAKEHADAMKSLAQVGSKAVGALAEGLGEMAAGKKVNMGAIMLKQLGDAVVQYGEKLLGIGALMLGTGDPMGTLKLAEGGGLVALGTALKATKMASGGIVHGSTFANIGEYAGASHNPEVVAPLDRLKSMMGGNTINVTHRIQGSDLVVCLNNELKNQGYGGTGEGLQFFGQ